MRKVLAAMAASAVVASFMIGAPAAVASGPEPGVLTFTVNDTVMTESAFANTLIDQASETLTVTITNPADSGVAGAELSAITPSGAGVAVAAGGTCSVEGSASKLTPGGDGCTVNLAWTPEAAGELAEASLTIAYADGASANVLVLTGFGLAAALEFYVGDNEVSSYDFDEVAFGDDASVVVKVTNVGSAETELSGWADLGAAGIALTGDGDEGTCDVDGTTTLAAATESEVESCTVTVTWEPTSATQDLDADLTVDFTNGEDEDATFELTGEATVASGELVFLVDGDEVEFGDFGTVVIDEDSDALVVTVTNPTGESITLSGISWAGDGVERSDEAGAGVCADSTALAKSGDEGDSCTISLIWTPSAFGDLEAAALTIESNDDAAVNVLALAGFGWWADGELTFNPEGAAFGSVTVDASKTLEVTVNNPTDNAITPTLIDLQDADSVTVDESSTCAEGTPIPAKADDVDGSCTLSLTWTPTSAGTLAGSVAVVYDDTYASFLSLSGTAAAKPGPAPAPAPAPTPEPTPTPTPTPEKPVTPVVPVGPEPVVITNPAAVTAADVAALAPERIVTIAPSVIAALPPAAFAGLTPAQMEHMTTAQVNAIRPARAGQLRPVTVAAMSPDQVHALRPASVGQLRPAAVRAMSVEQIPAIRPAGVASMTLAQVQAMTPAQLASMTQAQLRAMTQRQVQALTARQLAPLSAAQRRALNA